MNSREETMAVKKALVDAGFADVRVGHDRASWLNVATILTDGQDYNKTYGDVLDIAQEVTGRYGEYNGQIIVTLK